MKSSGNVNRKKIKRKKREERREKEGREKRREKEGDERTSSFITHINRAATKSQSIFIFRLYWLHFVTLTIPEKGSTGWSRPSTDPQKRQTQS